VVVAAADDVDETCAGLMRCEADAVEAAAPALHG